ncbi:hypothetical protein [Glacieibacterium sp.]|uniref:hypothetical protein n=1 Tax=Glacieibacterium sp. TaxID=2860237 RepID=UPI003B005D67
MTTPHAPGRDPARAAEIIAAYGADPLRWPDEERADVVSILAADPALRAARKEAARLDHILDAWATGALAGALADDGQPAHREAAAAAAAAASALAPATRDWRRATGGGLFAAAAAVAAAVVVMITPTTALHSPRLQIASTATTVPHVATPALTDEQAFSLLFTPTPDEEEAI